MKQYKVILFLASALTTIECVHIGKRNGAMDDDVVNIKNEESKNE